MAKPTVAQLQSEIEALKRRVAELEGLKAPPKRDPLTDSLEELKRAFERAEKDRPSPQLPPPGLPWPYYWREPYWLRTAPGAGYQWPPGTILC